MRPHLLVLLLVAGCSAPTPLGDCSPMNCGGCCDAEGQCQSGSSTQACGSGGFRCLSCAAGQRCGAASSCELDPNAPRGGGSAGGTGGGQAGLTAWQQEFVTAHNAARRAATPTPSPPLPDVTWDSAAEAFAKLGADRCVFDHRQQNQFGENLYASTQDSSPTDVVQSWDSEKADYRYASNTCLAVCGHYTQVVWRSSTKIGCATTRCTTNSPFRSFPTWYLTACNYSPPGNFSGQKPY
ncbi:MAG: CAP domain-containing protein [Myxococcaceae bacterium]|nr:CAP domain-containing protein [Myxococcaceae bacterium]